MEHYIMKIRIKAISLILAAALLTACSNNSEPENAEEMTQFRTTVDTFCQTIAEIDTKINSVNTADPANYTTELLTDLNSLNTAFSDFANVDFPAEFDYLEHLADEASDYMNTAVSGYTKVYTDNTLTADQMQTEFDHATEYYDSAFKRIKVIMTFLNGETSEDANVTSGESGTLTDPEP
jgi:hypothetical protein